MIYKEYTLESLNTFGFNIKAKQYACFSTQDDLKEILNSYSGKILVLGGGSNLVFQSDYDGLILQSKDTSFTILDENDQEVLVEVGAGMVWDEFVAECVNRKFYGAENLSAIPGSVGASPIQNIGAYGVEVKELIDSVVYFELKTHDTKTLTNKACQFAYRNSIFKQELKGKVIVTKVRFRLRKQGKLNLSYSDLKTYTFAKQQHELIELREAVIQIRANKLPDWEELGNVGSFFKNPTLELNAAEELCKQFPQFKYFSSPEGAKFSAAAFIQEAGFKGWVHKNVGVSPKHALILINRGGGNGQQIRELAELIIQKVQQEFGIVLEPEANFV